MRIVVNDIAAEYGGALTILRQFYNYIKENCHDDEWIFLLGDKLLEETDNIKILTFPEVKRSHWRKVWFDCVNGHTIIENFHPDVVISLQNIITFHVKAPQLVYVHQSIPFQNIKNFSFFKCNERSIAFIQKVIGWFIKKSIKNADHIIVQSNWMMEAIKKQVHVLPSKITRVQPTVNIIDDVRATREFSHKRFFYPTSNELYKNNELIVQACDLLNSRGYYDFKVELTLPTGTIKHKNIICLGRISYIKVQQHYMDSVLLFPSYIETVGLPLLEAKNFGTPIIAAETLHVEDVLNGYENYWTHMPFNVLELTNLMQKCIEDKIANKIIPNAKAKMQLDEWYKIYEIISQKKY